MSYDDAMREIMAKLDQSGLPPQHQNQLHDALKVALQTLNSDPDFAKKMEKYTRQKMKRKAKKHKSRLLR